MAAYKMYEFEEDYSLNNNLAVKKTLNYKKNNKKKAALNRNSKLFIVPIVLAVFVMTLIITSRYTMINEKNLESIRLKNDLKKAEATLFSTKIAVEQNTDLNKIESYAKQQLGMQKPTKNQIIYIDTSENIGAVEIVKKTDLIASIKNSVSSFINNIF